MCIQTTLATKPEQWVGELADVALPVALHHHVRGNSVDVELLVGHAVEKALKSTRTAGPEEVADRVAEGVYQAALRRGLPGSFLDLRLDLWHALRKAVA
jgi:hypothetical protein